MSQQVINQVNPGDGLGDTIYVAFGKCNDNFTELYDDAAEVPGYQSITLSAGDNDNLTLPGALDYVLDLDATAGNATVTGIVAQADGQRVTIRRKDSTSSTLVLAALNSGSSSANQLQIVSAGLGLPLQYTAVTLQYSKTLGYWVQT